MPQSHCELIVRIPNWVGDVIMALPALQALHENNIPLRLFGKPWAIDLLAATSMPVFSLSKNFWTNRRAMAAIKTCDKALLFTNSFSSALMTFMAGKSTIGYQTDHRQWLLTSSIAPLQGLHEVNYFFEIARFASQYWFANLPEIPPPLDKIHLPVSASSLSSAKKALQHAGIKKPFWVLCPFAHGTGKNGQPKIWPHWRELAAALHHHQLVVCPGKGEESLCATLVPNAIVLPGLRLSEYAAILMLSEQVIANDSGPMHMAAAVGANTLGIFGMTSPLRTRPWGGHYIGTEHGFPSLDEVLSRISNAPIYTHST